MFEELMRRYQMAMNPEARRISTTALPYEIGSANNMGAMGQKFGGLLGLTEPTGPDPMTLNQNNGPNPTFATPNAPQYGTTDSVMSGNPTESSAPLKKDGMDLGKVGSALGDIANGITGANQTPIKAPNMPDDSAQRAAAASQLWQKVMQKHKMKGLI